MIKQTYVVAYQDENNVPHFSVNHFRHTKWTPDANSALQFDEWQLAWDAMKYIEATDRPRFGMVVLTYDSVKQYSFNWLDEILDCVAEM